MKWIDVSNGCGGHNGEYDTGLARLFAQGPCGPQG